MTDRYPAVRTGASMKTCVYRRTKAGLFENRLIPMSVGSGNASGNLALAQTDGKRRFCTKVKKIYIMDIRFLNVVEQSLRMTAAENRKTKFQ